MKIAIAGIGGVGGYFGGLLARKYSGTDIEVCFIARGENEKQIRERGLELQTVNGNFTARPKLVTSIPSEAGKVDLLICCTKGYGLEEIISACLPCVSHNTVVLPLLNGVDARSRIEKILPPCELWDGCVYLVSRLAAPGVIRETGNIRKLFFGSNDGSEEKLRKTENIFREAGIEAEWSKQIRETTWEKFLFISPIATLTSFTDSTIGAVFANARSEEFLRQLVAEVKSVADAEGVVLPPGTTEANLERIRSLPFESTTSMHSDFRRGGKTELESLTGFVVREARRFRIPVPVYEMMYEKLKTRRA